MKQINPFRNELLFKLYEKLFNPELKYYNSFFKTVIHPKANKGKILMYVGIGGVYFSPIEMIMYHLLNL